MRFSQSTVICIYVELVMGKLNKSNKESYYASLFVINFPLKSFVRKSRVLVALKGNLCLKKFYSRSNQCAKKLAIKSQKM